MRMRVCNHTQNAWLPAALVLIVGFDGCSKEGGNAVTPTTTQIEWRKVLDAPTTLALALNQNDDVFVGTFDKRMYRATDDGTTWMQISDSATGLVLSVAVNSMGALFANSDIGTDTGGVIFRSTNNGDSWSPVFSTLTRYGNRWPIAINVSDHVFASFSLSLVRSTDAGGSWTQLLATPTWPGVLALLSSSSSIVFTGMGNGVFRSTDNGVTWNQTGTMSSVYSLAINSLGHIFAGSVGTAQGNGVYRSTDNGGSWTQVGANNIVAVSLCINSAGHVFAGGGAIRPYGIFRSTDNGGTWADVNGNLPSTSVTRLAVSSTGILFVGTDAGIFRTVLSTNP